MLTFGSLFAGIGGFDLGFERAGMRGVWQVEIDPFCQRVLQKNFPGARLFGDVRDVGANELESVDVICGGFPCQDISFAKTWTTDGRHTVDGINGSRSGLWKEYYRIVKELRPKWMVAENVKALTSKGLDIIIQDLSSIGYDAEWTIFPASIFGAPHLRQRLYIVAYPISKRWEQTTFFQGAFTGETIRHSPQWEPSRTVCKTYGKKTLPESLGIHDGVPGGLYRSERITALGNAVVPQIAEWIGRRIVEMENET